MATIALACYAVIAYGLLVWLGATLTLPGLAGFVLAIGLAIDANVLVFERAREEYAEREKSGLTPALSTGFTKAWSAILDSNVTTLLSAALLFFLASGPVRGFGVTLSIGVLASMFSALVVARVLAEWAVKRKPVRARPGLSGIAGAGRLRKWLTDDGPDLMRRSGTWIAVTVLVGVVSVVGIVGRGLDLGVEFTGGRLLEFSTSSTLDPEKAREAVSDAGYPTAIVQSSSGDGETENVTVRSSKLTNDQAFEIEQALGTVAEDVTKERDELIGPSLGDELRNKALIAFAVAIAAQMLYLAWRFRWTFAAAAVLSMTSVVLTVVGVFAWLGKPIDGVFLAAVLSIIGLAVNDTIVVFDRIREHTRENRKRPLRAVVNEAILQTIPRTVNTGLGAMFILAALAVPRRQLAHGLRDRAAARAGDRHPVDHLHRVGARGRARGALAVRPVRTRSNARSTRTRTSRTAPTTARWCTLGLPERQHVGRQCGGTRGGGRHVAPVVAPAQHLVADRRLRAICVLDVPDDDHLTLGDHLAVLGAGVVGGALPAPAQRLDLEGVHTVGELDEPLPTPRRAGTGSR